MNNVQKTLLKFSGCLTKALSEYHSGWGTEDYVVLAKKYYLADQGKAFQGDLSWAVVKNLPKFAVDPSVLTQEMKRGLLLDENDDPVPGTASSAKSLSMAERPNVGKKKAKKAKMEKACSQKASTALPLNDRQQIWDRLPASNELRSSVARIAF